MNRVQQQMRNGVFGMSIATDGYGCSVLFEKQKTFQRKPETLDMGKYHNKTIVGLDPGRKSIFTAAYLEPGREPKWKFLDLSSGNWKELTGSGKFKNNKINGSY
jgi:hypothetical protein